jgi:hypothetical protein
MSTEYLTDADVDWLGRMESAQSEEPLSPEFYRRLYGIPEPATLFETFGVGKYRRTYSCGCAWQNYCDECQEPQ